MTCDNNSCNRSGVLLLFDLPIHIVKPIFSEMIRKDTLYWIISYMKKVFGWHDVLWVCIIYSYGFYCIHFVISAGQCKQVMQAQMCKCKSIPCEEFANLSRGFPRKVCVFLCDTMYIIKFIVNQTSKDYLTDMIVDISVKNIKKITMLNKQQ